MLAMVPPFTQGEMKMDALARVKLSVKGMWYFYSDWYGFDVAQCVVPETHVAVSIFEESNITQYIFLSLM
jgi:hypothetical protein